MPALDYRIPKLYGEKIKTSMLAFIFAKQQPVLYSQPMKTWREQLHKLGLLDFAGLLLDVVEPLSPIGAQVLWVAQPTLGLLVESEKISAWAHLLEDPHTIARLRDSLAQEDFFHD